MVQVKRNPIILLSYFFSCSRLHSGYLKKNIYSHIAQTLWSDPAGGSTEEKKSNVASDKALNMYTLVSSINKLL